MATDDNVSTDVIDAQIEEEEAIDNAQLSLEVGRVLETCLDQPVAEQSHPVIVRMKNMTCCIASQTFFTNQSLTFTDQ